jgi:hypothetical protein
VNIAEEGELNWVESQKRQRPRKAKPIKKGKIPIMVLMTTGRAAKSVLLIKVY